jgi:hypothetical protein
MPPQSEKYVDGSAFTSVDDMRRVAGQGLCEVSRWAADVRVCRRARESW